MTPEQCFVVVQSTIICMTVVACHALVCYCVLACVQAWAGALECPLPRLLNSFLKAAAPQPPPEPEEDPFLPRGAD